jgi:hypothetical protein
MTLRSKLIRLAHENPALRPDLLPLLKSAAAQPTLPESWEIYSSIPGHGAVTRALNAAAKRAGDSLLKTLRTPEYKDLDPDYRKEDLKKVGALLASTWSKILYPVMAKYSDYGATDSEPRYHGGQYLVDVIKAFYGLGGFINLGDYI